MVLRLARPSGVGVSQMPRLWARACPFPAPCIPFHELRRQRGILFGRGPPVPFLDGEARRSTGDPHAATICRNRARSAASEQGRRRKCAERPPLDAHSALAGYGGPIPEKHGRGAGMSALPRPAVFLRHLPRCHRTSQPHPGRAQAAHALSRTEPPRFSGPGAARALTATCNARAMGRPAHCTHAQSRASRLPPALPRTRGPAVSHRLCRLRTFRFAPLEPQGRGHSIGVVFSPVRIV